MNLTEVGELSNRVLDEIERVVLGKREALELLILGLLADGHVLIEDYPGLAKTLMARSFAQVTSMEFSRIQFTPDLMPSDVTGSSIFNQRESDFEFRPGPIFTNLLLADEINRAPPKTQAALLEAMQERQVTTEGETRRLGPPFLVLATQNPIEYEGTYPLPEAQLDRFLLRMSVGYPAREDEWQVLANRAERRTDEVELTPLLDRETLIAMQQAVEDVYVSEPVGLYMVDVAAATRDRAVDPGRRLAARVACALEAVALPGGAAGPRLRDAGRRQVRRSPRARAPVDAPAGALGAAGLGRGCRARAARHGADAGGRRPRARVTRFSTPKLASYSALSGAGLLTALVFARPELVALTAPFLLALAAGLALATPPRLSVSVELDANRALEGDDVGARLVLEAATPVDRLDLYLRLPAGIEVEEGRNPVGLHLRAGERRELELRLRATRWGGHVLGPAYARVHDPLGLLVWESKAETRPEIRVYPREDVLRRVLQPRDTQVFTGNEVARTKGEGIEFADIRLWAHGDPLKRVNWRASARRGDLWVNESHPERNTDVILFVDSFAEARHGEKGTLDLAVRATATLADAYVGRRDRVGLIAFGGILRWLVPGMGIVHLYRIVDALLDTQIVLSYYWKEIDVIPRADVAAERARDRPLAAPRPAFGRRTARPARARLRPGGRRRLSRAIRAATVVGIDAVAYDIWTLRRDALRHRLQSAGVAVAEWRDDKPLQAIVEEVREFRRYARHARV